MLPFYVGALALGGVLILASIFLGGESDKDLSADHDADLDADADADLDADADADVDADADAELEAEAHGGGLDKHVDGETSAWLPFLSMRFWTFGLGSFGLAGVLLTLLGIGTLVSALASTTLGLGIGWGAAWLFRRLKDSNVSGNVGLIGLNGAEATVLLPMGPGKRGKIRALVDGQAVDLLADTGDGAVIDRKEKVLVVAVKDGIAQVTHLRRLGGPVASDPP